MVLVAQRLGLLAHQRDDVLEVRGEVGKAGGLARLLPGLLPQRGGPCDARHQLGGDLGGALVVTRRDPHQAGVVAVVRRLGELSGGLLEQQAKSFFREGLVREARQRGELRGARLDRPRRHVGLLIPSEHRGGSVEIGNDSEAILELGEGAHGCGQSPGDVRPLTGDRADTGGERRRSPTRG